MDRVSEPNLAELCHIRGESGREEALDNRDTHYTNNTTQDYLQFCAVLVNTVG